MRPMLDDVTAVKTIAWHSVSRYVTGQFIVQLIRQISRATIAAETSAQEPEMPKNKW